MECDKCGTDLNIHQGVIQITYPVFVKKKFKMFYLCRGCFLVGDNYRADEFLTWLEMEKVSE